MLSETFTMSKNNHLPKKNHLGAYELNIDDVSTDDIVADFEKAFKQLDQEAKTRPTKGRASQDVIRTTPKPGDETAAREYTLNTRYTLQDHIEVHSEAPKEREKDKSDTKTAKPGANDWLKQTAPVSQKSTPAQPAAAEPKKRIPPKPTEKPHTKEQMLEDLQDIMMAINAGSNELQKFALSHPYLIAPNIYGVWSDNLKETSISLMREYQRMRSKDLA